MVYDLSIVCYSGAHLVFTIIVAVPAFIVWILGIPIYLSITFYLKRNIIKEKRQNKDGTPIKITLD
jgi:hypothetical protein